MNYLSNNNLAYISNDNIYKSTFGIVKNDEIIDKDDEIEGGYEKNFLTNEQIQILLENFENKSNDKNKNLLFIILFFLLIFSFLIFFFITF